MAQIKAELAHGLVPVSVLVATIAAYAAFSLVERVRRTADEQERRWLVLGGAGAVGLGLLSMHWLGLLASAVMLLAGLGAALLERRRTRVLEMAQQALLASRNELLANERELVESREKLLELNALLSELSIRDGLTGLYNRRYFDTLFATEWRRAARERKPIALLMVDVDYFKALNDNLGHQRGDDCLREVARALEEQPKRGHDTTARYGGEEFAMVLPGATTEGAVRIAEATRMAVMALELKHPASDVAPFITVSIGVASCRPAIGDDAAALLQAADAALYRAKREGRNRVEAGRVMVRSGS